MVKKHTLERYIKRLELLSQAIEQDASISPSGLTAFRDFARYRDVWSIAVYRRIYEQMVVSCQMHFLNHASLVKSSHLSFEQKKEYFEKALRVIREFSNFDVYDVEQNSGYHQGQALIVELNHFGPKNKRLSVRSNRWTFQDTDIGLLFIVLRAFVSNNFNRWNLLEAAQFYCCSHERYQLKFEQNSSLRVSFLAKICRDVFEENRRNWIIEFRATQ